MYIFGVISICSVLAIIVAFYDNMKYAAQVKYYTKKHERKVRKENGK